MKTVTYREYPGADLDLSLKVPKDGELVVDITDLWRIKPLKVTGNIDIQDGGKLTIVQVDFGNFDIDLDVRVTLKEKSEFYYHLAALATATDRKIYTADVVHVGKESKSRTSMFGVCMDESHMEFLGSSDIKRGAAKTWTRQEGKIVNLSSKAKGVVSPALLIGEEDVFASHGATMGSVPDDDIFYLMSRGLDLDTAKRLIMVGYLKPVALMLENPKVKDEAIGLLEKEI